MYGYVYIWIKIYRHLTMGGYPKRHVHSNFSKLLMKMNLFLFGYTYKIYDIGYKTEMMSKECNAGDPLETPGGLYRGPPSNGLYNI